MVWENQESWEPSLVGFWVNRHSKMRQKSVNIYFGGGGGGGRGGGVSHYGPSSYFEILNSSRVVIPLPPFWGTPTPFLGTPSFWSKLKKSPPSSWQPLKLVHVNCIKQFKTMVLCLVLYQVNWKYHYHYSLYFQT